MGGKLPDIMDNRWGCQLVLPSGTKCYYKARKTYEEFNKVIKTAVKGFQLYSVTANGTAANAEALNLATNYDVKAARFCLGGYLGGDKYLQNMSSAAYAANRTLSLPKTFDFASIDCRLQTIVLPYFIDGSAKFSEADRIGFEDACLKACHKSFMFAMCSGAPIKAVLVEIILGGSGGDLSDRFLDKFGKLLQIFDICVIVDEILTAGRVGPSLSMTVSLPDSFLACVEYITMGKFMDCALVLVRTVKKPTEVNEIPRGTSTKLNCGPACDFFHTVVKRIDERMIEKKNKEALDVMNVPKEHYWGQGCLLFTSMSRSHQRENLKCRLLPMLEPAMKTQKGRSTPVKHLSRSNMCELYMERAEEWICEQEAAIMAGQHAFLMVMVNHIFELEASQHVDELRFRPENLCEFLGNEEADKLALTVSALRSHDGSRHHWKMTPLKLAEKAITLAISNLSDTHAMYKKRKGSARTEYTIVDRSLFDS